MPYTREYMYALYALYALYYTLSLGRDAACSPDHVAAFQGTRTVREYVYTLCVCLTHMPYKYALHVCLMCMPSKGQTR